MGLHNNFNLIAQTMNVTTIMVIYSSYGNPSLPLYSSFYGSLKLALLQACNITKASQKYDTIFVVDSEPPE